jgi:hypothetical protein
MGKWSGSGAAKHSDFAPDGDLRLLSAERLGLRATLSFKCTCTPHHNNVHSRDAGHTADQAASHLHRAQHHRDCALPGLERTEKIARAQR